MFVRKMGRKVPANLKVGLTAEEARVLAYDLSHVLLGFYDASKGNPPTAVHDRLADLVRKLEDNF